MLSIFKGATVATIVFAYLMFWARGLQIAGLAIQKPMVAYAGYGACSVLTGVIYLITFFTD